MTNHHATRQDDTDKGMKDSCMVFGENEWSTPAQRGIWYPTVVSYTSNTIQ